MRLELDISPIEPACFADVIDEVEGAGIRCVTDTWRTPLLGSVANGDQRNRVPDSNTRSSPGEANLPHRTTRFRSMTTAPFSRWGKFSSRAG